MVKIRRRGAAIVKTPKGIMLVAFENKEFMLPGGGANWWESRRRAAIRELKEETGLRAKSAKYIFSYLTREFMRKGKVTRNHAKVYLIEAEGTPKPSQEIKHIAYWKEGSKLKLMNGAKIALAEYKKYLKS